MSKLKGKVAVVTGGSEGIGLATVKLFVKEGAYVFITGRRPKELDKAAKAIGENVTGVQGDASNLADLDRLYETVTKAKGRIDIVIANAGLAEFVPFGKVTEEHFDRLFNINVKGTLFTVQKALPPLPDAPGITPSRPRNDQPPARGRPPAGIRGVRLRSPKRRLGCGNTAR
jgi:NAD(P)-dependent dehydrogenase (short-subunit alcohol dehydrogenase family)